MSFEGGYQSDVVQYSGAAKGGAIFITDIAPQNVNENVAAKVFSSDGLVLQSCSSSTDLIKVSVLAITGFSSFKPIVMIENQLVSLTQDEDQDIWKGTIDIDLKGKSFIEAIHNDGAFHRCLITDESSPVITKANFIGGYPNGQIELKENDLFDFEVEASQAFVAVEVDSYGAAKAKTYNFQESTTANFDIVIADKGNSRASFGVRLRVVNSNGTKSEWLVTEKAFEVDGLDVVYLNNIQPTISIQSVNYPENQQALKGNEQAILIHTIGNFDSVTYSSELAQLEIAEANSYATTKQITRIDGGYNTTENNLKIVATRTANGSRLELNEIIKIANIPATITFGGNETRLVSGGNNQTDIQRHQLKVQSNQVLLGVPEIIVEHGILNEIATQVGDNANYVQEILIHDNDPKGSHEASLIKATNLAGIETTVFTGEARYTIGGFVKRILQFQEFSNEAAIGTKVSDPSKLIAQDNNEIRLNYTPSLEISRLSYTITEPTNIVNPTGGIFHWNDEEAVNNNSTGLATISVEELA